MEGLARNDAITSLDLSHNKVSNAGARLLAKLLGHHSVLTSLNLCDNSVRADGGRCLARGLRGNDALVELNLRLNRLGDDGGSMLLRGLLPHHRPGGSGGALSGPSGSSPSAKHSSTSGGGPLAAAGGHSLARLNLASNGLGARSAQALAEVLVSQGESAAFGPAAGGFGDGFGGGGLQLADLNGNGLTGDDAASLAAALRSGGHPFLTSLDLRGNPCSAAGAGDGARDALDAIAALTRANELSAR